MKLNEMRRFAAPIEDSTDDTSSDRRAHHRQEMKDYASVGLSLVWQRLMVYGSAFSLAAYYYNLWLSLSTMALILSCEAFDIWTFKKILRRNLWTRESQRHNMRLLYLGTTMSSLTIFFYVVWISALQGPTTHFMPLFFLFAASLFAAMNNHQLLQLLVLRLAIYGTAFLAVPIWDIWKTAAPIESPLWTQFFTSAFVLFFIIDCSRVFLKLYRRQVQQMEELRRKHEKAKIAYKAKSEFLSTMSHELRTPMTSISGAVILARSGKLGVLPKAIDSVLNIAQLNCARLSTLINDILDLQKIEAGKLKFEFKLMELGAFLRKSVDVNAPYGEKLNVKFIYELPASKVYVMADEQRMDQVMANLLSNAAKFSNEGDSVVVRLEVMDSIARILVVDRGVGLSEDKRELVFDQFSQLDSSDQRKIGGTGLGMNISKRILDAHDGAIDYRKNAGPGTTFFVDLKLAPSVVNAEAPAERAA